MVFFRWAIHQVSMYFLGKAVFRFLPRVKRSCFRGKNTIFPDNTERSCAGAAPFGKAIFSESLKKISYFRVFFKKDHLSFSVQRVRSYFWEKEISSFPIIQERSYSTAIFQKDHLFRTSGKRKYGFSWRVNSCIQE